MGYSSRFLIQIYLPRRRSEAVQRAADVFGGIDSVEAPERPADAMLRHQSQVLLELSSPAMEFAAPNPVRKVVSKAGAETVVLGCPKEGIRPGLHDGKLRVYDPDTEQEHLAFAFEMNIVDYSFDHVSRPLVLRAVAVAVGLATLFVVGFGLVTQIGLVVEIVVGALGTVLTVAIIAWMNRQFRQPNVAVNRDAEP
jgi:hypothetical protein